MKKLIMFVFLFLLFGCEIGDFPDNRNRLHDLGHEKDICEKYPDRCINGVQW